jgi:hypothetical protein
MPFCKKSGLSLVVWDGDVLLMTDEDIAKSLK